MTFTIDSPTRYSYVDTRDAAAAVAAVEAETSAILRSIEAAAAGSATVPAPSGYRITHVFQVASDDGEAEDLQYVESMDVESWEQITSAIEVMLTRTRAEGWTVSFTVVQFNLTGAEISSGGIRCLPGNREDRGR